MISVSSLLSSREPTPLESEAIEELVAYARRYRDSGRDRSVLYEIMRACPAKQTTLIRFITARTDRHRMVLDLIEDMVAHHPLSPYVHAVNGTHHRSEVEAEHGRVRVMPDGRKFIEWPTWWSNTVDEYGRTVRQPLYDPHLILSPPDFSSGVVVTSDRHWWEEGSIYGQKEFE